MRAYNLSVYSGNVKNFRESSKLSENLRNQFIDNYAAAAGGCSGCDPLQDGEAELIAARIGALLSEARG